MPCVERFKKLNKEKQWEILPPSSLVVVVEAGVSDPWLQFADDVIGIDRFGASAPAKILEEKFQLTPELI